MKKIYISTAIILSVALYLGCAKKKSNLEFDITYKTDIAIPTYTAANQTYTIISNDIPTNINDELAKNGTDGDLVGEMKYTQFDVAVKTPTIQSANFIKQMKFYINAYNQPELQVAFKYNEKQDTIKPTDKSTSFVINESNLKNRFMENSIYFKIKCMTTYPTSPTTITVTHKVHVKAITK